MCIFIGSLVTLIRLGIMDILLNILSIDTKLSLLIEYLMTRMNLNYEFQGIVFYALDHLKVKTKTFHLKTTIKYRFPNQPKSA